MSQELTDEELKEVYFLSQKYNMISKIGEGAFGSVYKAKEINNNLIYTNQDTFVAIKAITKTTAPRRILNELELLSQLRGCSNIIQLIDVIRKEDQICAVFPYFKFTDFHSFKEKATLVDIKHYMYNLLLGLNQCHKNRIIHRDIKPANFLYDYENKTGILIDFGLAEKCKLEIKRENVFEDSSNKRTSLLFFNNTISRNYAPGYYTDDIRPDLKAPRAGTRGYRAPEILLRSYKQSSSIDIWSAGVIFLMLLTKKYPFFNSSDDMDAIVEIATIFGHEKMKRVAKYYERSWKSNISTIPWLSISFEFIVEQLNSKIKLTEDAFDLLYKMLELNGDMRILAEDAINHPFFDDIKRYL